MGNQPDIRAGRLPDSAYAENFGDVHPPLDRKAALVEASRCYFCYDAPCIEACPTGIDIPSFIRKISTDNVRGAAQDILEENILDRKSTRLNSSHYCAYRMPSSACTKKTTTTTNPPT